MTGMRGRNENRRRAGAYRESGGQAREEPPPAEYDLVKTEYWIARHPEILHEDGWERALGLARVEHRIPRPDSAQTGAKTARGQMPVLRY